MPPKLTQEEFIARAKEKHGLRYEYPSVNYINSTTKVKIGCPIHGEFLQRPSDHLYGNGCPDCNQYKKLTKNDFLKAAKEKHKGYFYLAPYESSYQKIDILCITCIKKLLLNYRFFKGPTGKNFAESIKYFWPEGAIFRQRPASHIRGSGCPKCAGNQKMTNEEFIARAELIHKYNYEKVNYKNSYTKIKIICSEHGEFGQTPSAHLAGSGCPKCGIATQRYTQNLTLNEFKEKAMEIHGGFYDYPENTYINNKTPIKIICPVHGEFMQRPMIHLRGGGCSKCAGRGFTTRELIKKAEEIHDNKYTYKYIGLITEKAGIICPEHGEFMQILYAHLHGSGCPKCANYGFNPNKPATLYYLKDLNTGLYKIGITNKTVHDRFGSATLEHCAVLEQIEYENGEEAYLAEQEILQAFGCLRCVNDEWPEKEGGKTEFFKEDILKLDKEIK
jgi:hypothetical protein